MPSSPTPMSAQLKGQTPLWEMTPRLSSNPIPLPPCFPNPTRDLEERDGP